MQSSHSTQLGFAKYLLTKFLPAYTGLSINAIYKAIAAGRLKPVSRRGRSYVFDRDHVDQFMSGRPVEPSTPSPPVLTLIDGGASSRGPFTSTEGES